MLFAIVRNSLHVHMMFSISFDAFVFKSSIVVYNKNSMAMAGKPRDAFVQYARTWQ